MESCVTDNTRFKCTFCDEFFPSPEVLEEHTICHKEKIHSCDICSKVFQDSHSLERHFVVHTSEALFFCNVCNAGFIQESELKNHKAKKHKPTPYSKIYQCDICQKRFITAYTLDRHYSFHIGGKPFVCKLCNISFALHSHFEKHNQVEHLPFSDESNRNWKLHSCDYCPLTFVVKKTLRLHLATHKHKKRYGCKECSKSFASELELEEHYIKHIQEYYHILKVMTSFGCSNCNQYFPLFSDLEEHKQSHEDSISIAPLTFSFSNELINRMLSETSKSETDFILNSDINTHENRQSRGAHIITSSVSSELLRKENNNLSLLPTNNLKVFESDSINKSSTGNFYIITQNEDGSFESNVFNNCVVLVDDDSQIKNVAHDVELSETQISTDHQEAEVSTSKDWPYSCDVCKQAFRRKSTLILHQSTHNGLEHSKDEGCVDTANMLSDIADDTLGHAAEISTSKVSRPLKSKRIWTCKICQKTFTKSRDLRLHSNIHNDEKPYSCDVCKQAFRHESTLNLHMSTHNGLEPCVCEKCGKSFPTEHHLNTHFSYHHARQYTCDICGVELKTKASLKCHQYTHTSVRPYKCEICNKGFIKKYRFEFHQKFHRGETLPHTCTDCGKVCVNELYLKRHKMIHTGVKPYPCDLCPKAFVTKASMENHFLAMHTEQGKYRCNVCGKPFHMLEQCQKHMKSHTREPQYECGICGVKFAEKRNLQFHYVTHTKKDPFTCDVCEIRFKRVRELTVHKQKIHRIPHPNTRNDSSVDTGYLETPDSG